MSLKFNPKAKISDNELKVRVFGMSMANPEQRYKNAFFNDIPVMITNDGKILCIPESKEVKHVGVTGMTGTSKSLTLNALMGWDYWLMKRDCINLNDFQMDTFDWSFPTESYLEALDTINAKPTPLPLVYVFPTTKTLQEPDKKIPHIKMTLPLDEVIKNIENYHKLDKSKVYLGNLMDELLDCNSMKEVKDVIEENLPEKHKMMKYKILNVFEDIFNNKIINVSVPEAPAFLEYRDKKGNRHLNHTIQTLLRAGFIPSIQTSDLRNYEFFPSYMSFIVNSIYNAQYENEYFKKRPISLFVDEIDKLWKGKKGNIIKSTLGLVGTNGRSARIGLRWATQHYEQVPDQIRGNTQYLFVSRKNKSKEVGDIKKDFDIPKSMEKDILELTKDTTKGLFEMVATTTEYFVLYDATTGEKTKTSMAKRGYLIPPMARHMVPK